MAGLKLDDGKLRYALVDEDSEREFVAVLTFGAVKYDPGNWKTLDELERRYYEALRRHVSARRRGVLVDPETKMHHLAGAMCCLHFLLAYDLEQHPELVASFEQRFRDGLEVARAIRAAREAKAGKTKPAPRRTPGKKGRRKNLP